MVELNELSIVLIVLMVIIIIAILILGQRKKKKYQESAAKAKQQAQELRAQSKATPSKDAARFEDGRILPSKNPFGRLTEQNDMPTNDEPYIANLDEKNFNPNQHELAFENEPHIGDFASTDSQKVASEAVTESAPLVAEPQITIENPETITPQATTVNTEVALELNAEQQAQQLSQERQRQAMDKIMNSDRVEAKTFALIVMGKELIELTEIHQFMMANNLVRTNAGFYEFQDNRGNMIFQAVNMLNPGTFPSNPSLKEKTPGIMFVLDLPTPHSTAPGAMHNFITVAKKLANRTEAQVFNEEQHLVGEHYYHSLRDSALGYESTKVMP
ncbi:hypothetical protein THMIRHAS_13150 [Thiosulfatimonas sediminis]|uniref:Cell division protein ZipA n=1 Tax=Thiosulfatimonas sediminis TaxID=2675054 RepID=A0A6F8PUX0_9GAMM|nr:cell division protein ZipA C-terminal FtsZ-binding domain-containing protein [Thiosulfatimonas sediminis]BBP45942.1 hypothetical protein THMIRHAS_13150 [Thiosulfatimonas sediminis]